MVAKWVGDFFNEGIYDEHIEFQKIPLLVNDYIFHLNLFILQGWNAPFWMTKYRVSDIMSRPVRCFREVEKVKTVVYVFTNLLTVS